MQVVGEVEQLLEVVEVLHSQALTGTNGHSRALTGTHRHSQALTGTHRHSGALRSIQWHSAYPSSCRGP
jgi:hypothetical protein